MLKIRAFMERIAQLDQIPELKDSDIHIWGVHVPGIMDQLNRFYSLLSSDEQEKAERFHGESDRSSSIAARGALRVLLSVYTGVPPEGIDFHYIETGKPYLPDSDVAFNVSHSGAWVVLAFGRNRNVGVDIEQIKERIHIQAIADRYFTRDEIDSINEAEDARTVFFSLWARKEAYVKACGSALFRELSSFTVPLAERAERDGWIFQRLEAGAKYAAAIVTDKEYACMPCYDFGGLKWDS